jgi:lipoic acid synthetase
MPSGEAAMQTAGILRRLDLATVCQEARCPNLGECFAEGTATFMIMGRLCTRQCRFCAVEHGRPEPLDPGEPQRLARAAAEMRLRHVVVTSVTRDDLDDGGAAHFRRSAEAVKAAIPECAVELLVPDFQGRLESLEEILRAPIDVLTHNVETVPRLYPSVRPEAEFHRSLALLRHAHRKRPDLSTKSGLMVGLGETASEVADVLVRLREAGCSIVTIGQYLQPTRSQLPVTRYVPPEEFAAWAAKARALGFARAVAGPLVRSSYHAANCVPDR